MPVLVVVLAAGALAARASRSARHVLRGASAPAVATAGFSASVSAFAASAAERGALDASSEDVAATVSLDDDPLPSVGTLAQPPKAKTPTKVRSGKKFRQVIVARK